MARFRGIPLDSDCATFAAYEDRVNHAALHRHLTEVEDAEREAENEGVNRE